MLFRAEEVNTVENKNVLCEILSDIKTVINARLCSHRRKHTHTHRLCSDILWSHFDKTHPYLLIFNYMNIWRFNISEINHTHTHTHTHTHRSSWQRSSNRGREDFRLCVNVWMVHLKKKKKEKLIPQRAMLKNILKSARGQRAVEETGNFLCVSGLCRSGF